MSEQREPRFRNSESEEKGEWVTTRYMIQDLKLFTLEQLRLMKIKDVVKSYDGDLKNKNHRQRAGLALQVAKSQHPENK